MFKESIPPTLCQKSLNRLEKILFFFSFLFQSLELNKYLMISFGWNQPDILCNTIELDQSQDDKSSIVAQYISISSVPVVLLVELVKHVYQASQEGQGWVVEWQFIRYSLWVSPSHNLVNVKKLNSLYTPCLRSHTARPYLNSFQWPCKCYWLLWKLCLVRKCFVPFFL